MNLLIRRLLRYASVPQWYIFRLKIGTQHYSPESSALSNEKVQEALENKEKLLQAILTESACEGGKRFLEIGIGENPRLNRILLMQQHNIQYTACDFQSVCERHERVLQMHRIALQNIRFAPNKVGTYAWTLVEMLQRGEVFDVIYVDGHHTLYVDLPAFILAHFLLKPGGYVLVDDIRWTLNFLKNNMRQHFNAWYFYRKMYDFSEYEPYQQSLSHIRVIAEQMLITKLGYLKVEESSMPEWWTLKKPN